MSSETPHDRANGERLLVIDTATAAHNLPRMLERFRNSNPEPLFFGDAGKPEGVVVSFEEWERLESIAEDADQTERSREVTRERLTTASPDQYVPVDDLAEEFGWDLNDDDKPQGDGTQTHP
ncbi:type II toxin-antitoxin system Phd/YefM family antitoxin [Streptomyces sp. SID13031]|uniref:type II toxin-antitoxin system Phd/YefM family antitoxin n=1 Tax=Streptomyces sp. SID13031 TaxID=2706046 RepID=UPI0013CC2379|nr:type II toxin-antitoxin system Phd/YefM family antitoxin [Streptomyces sp. SID13031]NEA30124.1 type II toxin-antitoxin system Phd/YefM family antitoxin [Streptomyces sp. SID13031]